MHLPLLRRFLALLCLSNAAGHAATDQAAPVRWLGDTPAPLATGVSFGVPWPRGAVPKSQAFTLTTADNRTLPVQTWPLAYWPDGSLKWVGVATVAGPETKGELKLHPVATTTVAPGGASLDAMPLGLRTGRNLVFGYDPATGKLYQLSDEPGVYNLATIMGGAETVFELNLMLDDPRWQKLWLQYCRLYTAPKEVIERDMKTGNEAFRKAGIDALVRVARGGGRNRPLQRVDGPESLNPVDEGLGGTNGASQSGLETIAMLGLVGDHLPKEIPPITPEEQAAMSRRRGGGNPPPAQQPATPPKQP